MNNHNNHNLPIDGEDPNVRFEKAEKAYKKLVKEGRLDEFKKWEKAYSKQMDIEKKLGLGLTGLYMCTVCNDVGQNGEVCEKCNQDVGAVYAGPMLTHLELSNALELTMDEKNA